MTPGRGGSARPPRKDRPLESIGSPALWAGFVTFVIAMLALDLGVFHRKAHEVSVREAAVWSAVWISLAALFGAGLWVLSGPQQGMEFFTGYVIEKALSVDNIFVFVMVFSAFAVPAAYQHRVLFWGILGALVMRAAFIGVGAALLARFHWVLWIFGALLLVTGLKMLVVKGDGLHPEKNPIFRLFRRFVPATSTYHGARFTVREAGRLVATPLLTVLVLVEITDLIFAVDSIPAIFAITRDPFIVFTSNIFAILGLRSLYFLLAGMVGRFVYLKPALALVLTFVGAKMLVAEWWKIPTWASLSVIAVLVGGGVVVSLLRSPRLPEAGGPRPGSGLTEVS